MTASSVLSSLLTAERAAQLLNFEASHTFEHTDAKDTAIRRELDLTAARYYQLLRRLIWSEQALRIDPQLTYRLRRLDPTTAHE